MDSGRGPKEGECLKLKDLQWGQDSDKWIRPDEIKKMVGANESSLYPSNPL